MVDHSYDWILTGLALDLSGGWVLAKGFVFKRIDDAYREAQPRFGVNSFAVRSALFQKGEAVVGGTLLTAGFALQMWGNFHGGPAASALGWVNSWPPLALLLFVSAIVTSLSIAIAHRWAQRRFLVYFTRKWNPNVPPLTQVGSELDGLGLLFELERRSGETDDAYRQRLEAQRAALGMKYAGQETDVR